MESIPDCCAEKKKTSTVRLHDGAHSCTTAERFLPKTVRFCLCGVCIFSVCMHRFLFRYFCFFNKNAHQVTSVSRLPFVVKVIFITTPDRISSLNFSQTVNTHYVHVPANTAHVTCETYQPEMGCCSLRGRMHPLTSSMSIS